MDSLAVNFTGSKPLADCTSAAGWTSWVESSRGLGSVRPKGSKRVPDSKVVEEHKQLLADSASRTTSNSRAAEGVQPGLPIVVPTFLLASFHLAVWDRLSFEAFLGAAARSRRGLP